MLPSAGFGGGQEEQGFDKKCWYKVLVKGLVLYLALCWVSGGQEQGKGQECSFNQESFSTE